MIKKLDSCIDVKDMASKVNEIIDVVSSLLSSPVEKHGADMTRLILCRNCSSWKQAPNPEQGTCVADDMSVPTNYDTRCLLGLYETVQVPEIEIIEKQ